MGFSNNIMQMFQYLERKIYFLVYIFFSKPCFLRKKDLFLWRGGGNQANRRKESRKTLLNLNNSKIFLKGTCCCTSGLSGKLPH